MPALHRFAAVYRYAIPPLHGRVGRQRRSWATSLAGRFACTTSSSASSVLLSSCFEGTVSAVTMLARSLVWSCNNLGHAFMYGHGDERRSWATFLAGRFACTTSSSASSVLLSSCFEDTVSAVTMLARLLVWRCNSLSHAFTYGHGDERRSWATFLVGCFACTTSPSTSSVLLSSCFEGTASAVTMLARLLVWSCNSLGHAFTYGHGDERRSWATFLVGCFACTTSSSASSVLLSSCFEGTASAATMLARSLVWSCNNLGHAFMHGHGEEQ